MKKNLGGFTPEEIVTNIEPAVLSELLIISDTVLDRKIRKLKFCSNLKFAGLATILIAYILYNESKQNSTEEVDEYEYDGGVTETETENQK